MGLASRRQTKRITKTTVDVISFLRDLKKDISLGLGSRFVGEKKRPCIIKAMGDLPFGPPTAGCTALRAELCWIATLAHLPGWVACNTRPMQLGMAAPTMRNSVWDRNSQDMWGGF